MKRGKGKDRKIIKKVKLGLAENKVIIAELYFKAKNREVN